MMSWPFQSLFDSVIKADFVFGSGDDYDEDYDEEEASPVNSTANSTLIFTRQLENVTANAGDKVVKLVCEVQNLDPNNDSKVTFAWRKNLASVDKSKRISVKTFKPQGKEHKHRSTLRIANVEFFDKGFYDCSASNGVDKIRSQSLLDVVADTGRSSSTLSFNPINYDGEITTIAPNLAASASFDPHLADLTPKGRLLETTRLVYNASQPFCQVYRGETCKAYMENKYVFVQPPYTQSDIEKILSNAFLVISQSNDISSSCNKFARPSLCYSVFPLCVDARQINTYQTTRISKYKEHNFKDIRNKLGASLRRICKEDCLLLETELCSKEYAIAKRHPVIGQTLELEECQLLPNETEQSSKNCLSLGVDHESVNKDDTCYWDAGELYRGVQNTSELGNQCLRWAHLFHIHLSEHPELTGHNYCRNPGGIEQQPFCYVDGDPIRLEICNITKCKAEAAATWERKRLNESQSSLTSRSSSLGNKTQSTSLSNEHSRNRRSRKRDEDSLDRVNPKNTMVSSNGDNFEIKITH
ncbi:tyrosine-protein kinase transmembrane receptor Ror-like [Asbolus verrucosus]|uniref:Tyrosine-protein kinase transmembrane receptor Ror-like n=1 Tax=Asbolus verrucosus TaxID=1661398 RepID=A0A482VKA2_ASBVE|nr:tyrosine-protein kinase transmembrane receptor Ror-like [Asbolus verrucosus]